MASNWQFDFPSNWLNKPNLYCSTRYNNKGPSSFSITIGLILLPGWLTVTIQEREPEKNVSVADLDFCGNNEICKRPSIVFKGIRGGIVGHRIGFFVRAWDTDRIE